MKQAYVRLTKGKTVRRISSPHECGNEQAHPDAVDEDHPQKELQGLHKAHV